jgi:hypothetical protein
MTYYASGTRANFYAAYFHKSNVSINGLAYGFPYDDQGGFSTNVQMPTPKDVTITLLPLTSTTKLALGLPGGQTVKAGQTFQVTVQAKLSSGDIDKGYRGTVHFSSSDGQAVLPADYTFVASDNGSHVFNVTLRTAGSMKVDILDSGNGLPASTTVTVQAGAASRLAFVKQPQFGLVNSTEVVTVEALDAFGNLATDTKGILTLTGLP